MTMKCACGCGGTLNDNEFKINKFGVLETMKQECINKGFGYEGEEMYLTEQWAALKESERLLAEEGETLHDDDTGNDTESV